MFQLATDTSDSLRYYGLLKSAAQIATYVGLLATTSLSVFDLLYRQRSDPADGSNRYALNAAGKGRLIAFILISALTLSSAVTKDYADQKLGAISAEAARVERNEDKADRVGESQMLASTKHDTELVLDQNRDLQMRIDHLVALGAETGTQQATGGGCLKSAARTQLDEINAFLKDRLNKSPAYDTSLANDPHYSEKQVAYQRQTSQLYIEKFWPNVHTLIQRAAAAGINLKDGGGFADPAYYPQPNWSEAMLKPGLDEIVIISEHAPAC